MFRFFVCPSNITKEYIYLNDEDLKHIRSVRLRPDEEFVVCDSEGTDYVCFLDKKDGLPVAGILKRQKSISEPTVLCKCYMAFSKGDRLDYAVQKAVELGVHEIILFESEHCVAVPNDIPKKVTRLSRIAYETAKLSGRGKVSEVSYGGKLEKIINDAILNDKNVLFFYEEETELNIKDILCKIFPPDGPVCSAESADNKKRSDGGISIITGPEGGFSSAEASLVRSKNIPVVSLGSRILRSETAPVVALSAIMYHTGNL